MRDEILRQLTAYVDGELTPAEIAAVEKLLRDSEPARTLLTRLRRDAEAIRQLPAVALPTDFTDEVLAEIRSRKLRVQPVARVRRRLPAWQSLAAAAAVVLAVGLGSYLLISDLLRGPTQPEVVRNGNTSPSGNEPVARSEPVHAMPRRAEQVAFEQLLRMAPEAAGNLRETVARGRGLVNPAIQSLRGVFENQATQVAGLLDPQNVARRPGEILTMRPINRVPFKTYDFRLPQLLLDPANLEADKLSQRLSQEPLHYFELACGESWRGFDRLRAAAQEAGFNLIVDDELNQVAAKKRPYPQARYVLYLDNVTPEQLLRLLTLLQAAEKRRPEPEFTSLLVQPLNDELRRWLADTLDVSAFSLAPAKAAGLQPPRIDPTRPISGETQKSLEKVAAGDARPPVTIRVGRQPAAVAVLSYPTPQKPKGKAVRQYLDTRQGAHPDYLQVAIVLRAAKG